MLLRYFSLFSYSNVIGKRKISQTTKKKNKLTKILDNPHAVATGKSFDELHNETFSTGFYDSTQFDVVDVVGNVYNRLVIWDALTLHAATKYFGTDLHNSRLFHLFFFDVEK